MLVGVVLVVVVGAGVVTVDDGAVSVAVVGGGVVVGAGFGFDEVPVVAGQEVRRLSR